MIEKIKPIENINFVVEIANEKRFISFKTVDKMRRTTLTKNLKAVIFDLNGIFIQSPKLSDRFEKDFNISSSVFLPKLSEIMEKVRKPNSKKAFTYWRDILREWKIFFSENEFWDYWFKSENQSSEMIDFARFLKNKGIKVFILSNNFKERADYYDHYPWMHEVIERVYFSWQTGLVKPDIKAWKKVLDDNNLKPEECIYFDDQQKNIDSAEKLGMKSFIFKDKNQCEKIINSF